MSTHEEDVTLDQLCEEDPVIRHLLRVMRDGRGNSLDVAVKELEEMGLSSDHVREAAERIRRLASQVQTARSPRAVVAGNIESWYPGPRDEDRNWAAVRQILLEEGWDSSSLDQLNDSSTKVVAQLPDPVGGGDYHCRGLVLGYVQSGKTTNFTAVIAKAADAGYRMFIVLSGVHNALRQQTQDRLNGQLWDENRDLWHRLTNEDDFRPTDSVDALLSAPGDQRVLAIVKKNGPRLKALKKWLFGARPEILAACPVLIIDDEADQASINTSRPDRRPTAINRVIKEIVNGLPKSAYVGYTATPFANVLIDPTDREDLFPSDFIVDLPRPAAYIGPEAIFGREPLEFDSDGVEDDGFDFVRSVPVDELEKLRPKGAKTRSEFDPAVTGSLDAAIRYFLLSTAARRSRGLGNPHSTMLVHTSQFTDVHQRTADAISGHVRGIAARLARRDQIISEELRRQWEDESDTVPAAAFGHEAVSWDEVSALLPTVASDAELIIDNSKSEDRLSFDNARPRVIIAVGGNTLSRGLTLEGLSVSYFVRTASAYDTLLQMGRWFGYRKGYADLTRIWMTDEMREWFHHFATVDQEIRYDIERYETYHTTPLEMAPRIRTHPKLAITAASKMQHAVRAGVSYSGRRLQTIIFNHRDSDWLQRNLDAGKALLSSSDPALHRVIRPGVTHCGPVPSSEIIDFLEAYSFHENSRDLDRELICKYISGLAGEGELSHFSVVVMGRNKANRSELGEVDLGLPESVGCINRARLNAIGGTGHADIKTLVSKVDRVVDLEIDSSELENMEVGDIARLRNVPEKGGKGDGSGLLALYPVSKDSIPRMKNARTRTALDAVEHVLGVCIVFPESSLKSAKVEYMTADVSSMKLEDGIEEPEIGDELVEEEVAAA